MMARKISPVDAIYVESFESVKEMFKQEGYDSSMNISDFYFINRKRLDPLIYVPSVHSDEFANMVRWHSPIGIECKKAILEYFKTKINQHNDRVAKELFPKVRTMIEDRDWDKKVNINDFDFYVTIDFSDFSFLFENRLLTIKDFTYAFSLGRIGNEVDLIGIDLSGINLSNCRLVNLCFHNANFDNANLFQLELIHTAFSNVSFRHARLASIRVKDGSFFNGADFTNACVFGINPLGDGCLTEPFQINEVSYFYLARLTLQRFFRFDSKHMVSQQPSQYTGFANNSTNEMTLPSTKSLREYIIWYQRTFAKIDRLPSLSIREGLVFSLSVLFTKHWTSFSALVITAFLSNLFFAGLYLAFASHFTGANVDLFSLFYKSILVFTSFGLESLEPLTYFGKLIVLSEIVSGYITLALFVYLMSKKIDRSY
jgi:hypothetical protein